MNTIKILHLFPKLLSLYGEYGNIAVLRRALETAGYCVQLDSYEDGSLDLEPYSMIYVGAGTEDNLLESIRRLMPYKEAISASVDSGKLWLATGNAMTLFGHSVARQQATSEALCLFEYDTHIFDTKRFLGDVVSTEAFGGHFVGFVNTSSVYGGISTPLLQLNLNPQLGNDKAGGADGIRHRNFYGTQLIGPVLVKNPHFLQYICRELTGEELLLPADSNAQKAYSIALSELTKRMQ